jgi:hypothetical protein
VRPGARAVPAQVRGVRRGLRAHPRELRGVGLRLRPYLLQLALQALQLICCSMLAAMLSSSAARAARLLVQSSLATGRDVADGLGRARGREPGRRGEAGGRVCAELRDVHVWCARTC